MYTPSLAIPPHGYHQNSNVDRSILTAADPMECASHVSTQKQPTRCRYRLRQRVHLNTTAFETFDCLAAADVVVGSRSSFSDTSGAVSTNIKVLTRDHQTEQDRVTLKSEAMESSGAVSLDEQLQMDTAISDWWHCSQETRGLTRSSAEDLAASQFYQTVDGSLP